ncbi:MAG: serine hydrolase [Gluconacetobacter sp.]|uniref:serine hydrolase n=1 Tax=Gluconacetobacter dulcium TaxID=2729096 RepID=UPI002180A568|nr:serine hydrolase [Gluconacetobacter dulcium]
MFSQASRGTLWSPHVLPPLPGIPEATQIHFRAYGYSWFVEDFFGRKRLWHTGTNDGVVSYVTFLPELKTGIVVLTNQDDYHATHAIATTLSAYAATSTSADWICGLHSTTPTGSRAYSRPCRITCSCPVGTTARRMAPKIPACSSNAMSPARSAA